MNRIIYYSFMIFFPNFPSFVNRSNWRVREIDRNGIIHTIAGDIKSTSLRPDRVDGAKSHVFPVGIAVDATGKVYIADQSTI